MPYTLLNSLMENLGLGRMMQSISRLTFADEEAIQNDESCNWRIHHLQFTVRTRHSACVRFTVVIQLHVPLAWLEQAALGLSVPLLIHVGGQYCVGRTCRARMSGLSGISQCSTVVITLL